MTQSDPASVNVSLERVKILKQKRELALCFYRFILIFFHFSQDFSFIQVRYFTRHKLFRSCVPLVNDREPHKHHVPLSNNGREDPSLNANNTHTHRDAPIISIFL